MKYRLSTLVLLTTLVAVLVGWIVDRSKKPVTLYFHLYSCHYDFLTFQDLESSGGRQQLN